MRLPVLTKESARAHWGGCVGVELVRRHCLTSSTSFGVWRSSYRQHCRVLDRHRMDDVICQNGGASRLVASRGLPCSSSDNHLCVDGSVVGLTGFEPAPTPPYRGDALPLSYKPGCPFTSGKTSLALSGAAALGTVARDQVAPTVGASSIAVGAGFARLCSGFGSLFFFRLEHRDSLRSGGVCIGIDTGYHGPR